MNRWREYFKEPPEDDNSEMSNNGQEDQQQLMTQDNNVNTEEITEKELTKAIEKIKISKAPGHDQLSDN